MEEKGVEKKKTYSGLDAREGEEKKEGKRRNKKVETV